MAWTIALALFAGASAAQWWGASAGWGGLAFRAFYLLGPILSVPELALGTVLLLGSPKVGRATRVGVHAWALVSTGVLLAALTTIVGFGSLATSHYPGLVSMGLVSILGTLATALVAIAVVPAWLAWRARGVTLRR